MIRVYVGCASNNEDLDSQAVLEWSIRKNTKREVQIVWMQQTNNPENPLYGWNSREWATPFSAFRWAVPHLAGYQGKAIYTDSDVIFMADIGELYDQQHPDNAVLLAKGGGQWRLCVSMWDCAKAQDFMPDYDDMKADPQTHRKMTTKSLQPGLIAAFDGEWNCLDREIGSRPVNDSSIKAIHYTDMRSQPQLRHAIPRLQKEGGRHWFDGGLQPNKYPKINTLFDQLLIEAYENGYTLDKYKKEPFGKYR